MVALLVSTNTQNLPLQGAHAFALMLAQGQVHIGHYERYILTAKSQPTALLGCFMRREGMMCRGGQWGRALRSGW